MHFFYCFPPAAVRHNAPPPQVHPIGGLRLVRRLLLLHRGPRRGRARRRGSRVGIEAQGRKEEYLLTLSPFMCTWWGKACVCAWKLRREKRGCGQPRRRRPSVDCVYSSVRESAIIPFDISFFGGFYAPPPILQPFSYCEALFFEGKRGGESGFFFGGQRFIAPNGYFFPLLFLPPPFPVKCLCNSPSSPPSVRTSKPGSRIEFSFFFFSSVKTYISLLICLDFRKMRFTQKN